MACCVKLLLSTLFLAFVVVNASVYDLFGQSGSEQTVEDEPFDEGLFPEPVIPGAQEPDSATGEEPKEPRPEAPAPTEEIKPEAKPDEPEPMEKIEGGEAGEGETRWKVNITAAVILGYVFSDSGQGFTVKYRIEVEGQANAESAVIKGDANISADVSGALAKWPTGECKLNVTIPKVPFELSFKKTGEDKGSLRLILKRSISEDWQSTCTFTDAPGAHFDTRGQPEEWLNKALEKARPPLKEIVAEIGREETTTTFVISKETVADPPVGNCDIEGTGVVTIKPGS